MEASLKVNELRGASVTELERLRQVYRTAGTVGFHRADAQMVPERAKNQPLKTVLERLSVANAYVELGDNTAALEILEKICGERSGMAGWIKIGSRRYPKLSSDPRFQALLRRIGLPQ